MNTQFLNFVKDYDNVVFIKASYNNLIVNNGQKWTINHDYLLQYKSKLIIVDFASEHWNQFDDNVYHDLDASDYNFLLLTYDHNRHQMYPKMFYYPYWYYTSTEWPVTKNNTVESRTFDLGCLNAGPRPHRIANYYHLMKKSYKDQISISFHNIDNKEQNYWRQDDVTLLDEELNYWNSIRHSLPLLRKPHNASPPICLPQLFDSYLHLVTETTVIPGVFITEKTWKPVIAGVPFLVFGNPGTMSFLKTLGVDTYDDVIDHAYYDNEVDWRERLAKMYTILDKLIEYGAEKIYQQLFVRAQNNQTKFYNGEFDPGYQSQLISAIEHVRIR
jgi:hypothetical protein